MCTASWCFGDSSLTLCFSRDERKTRSEAIPPSVYSRDGCRYLAAIDPDGGGTWAAVNEHGLCVFLLNNYRAASGSLTKRTGMVSRGSLPVHFAGCQSRDQAVSELREYCLDNYNPFILCFADTAGVVGFAWNGKRLDAFDLEGGMVTTCSFRSEEIEAYRKERYVELRAKALRFGERQQRKFHTELQHPDAAFNTLMRREESRTHSISTVFLDEHGVRFVYESVQAEERQLNPPEIVTLARPGASAGDCELHSRNEFEA